MNDRRSFLKNALMAVAVSLLPKTLRPVEQLFEAGESPFNSGKLIAGDIPFQNFAVWIPKYDPKRSYFVDYGFGSTMIASGACLNEMDRLIHEEYILNHGKEI